MHLPGPTPTPVLSAAKDVERREVGEPEFEGRGGGAMAADVLVGERGGFMY